MAQAPQAAQTVDHTSGTVVMAQPVPQTSLSARLPPPGQVCLQFRRWFEGYQPNQVAGFMPGEARRIQRTGAAFVVEVDRVAAGNMVRK